MLLKRFIRITRTKKLSNSTPLGDSLPLLRPVELKLRWIELYAWNWKNYHMARARCKNCFKVNIDQCGFSRTTCQRLSSRNCTTKVELFPHSACQKVFCKGFVPYMCPPTKILIYFAPKAKFCRFWYLKKYIIFGVLDDFFLLLEHFQRLILDFRRQYFFKQKCQKSKGGTTWTRLFWLSDQA